MGSADSKSFIWDGANLIAELNSSGNVTAKYLRGINLISSETAAGTRYFSFDAHGDVVQLTDAAGTVVKDYRYDAFGNEENSDPNDSNVFRYCGEMFDKETGTYYLRARHFNPKIGRFTSEDSVRSTTYKMPNGIEVIDPLSLNLYTYCGNNPIRYIDPTGRSFEDIWKLIESGAFKLENDAAGRTILLHYLYGGGKNLIINGTDNTLPGTAVVASWGDYMMSNKGNPAAGVAPLKVQMQNLILPYGESLGLGESMQLDLTTAIQIENGEGIIGYQYLHGTNADVGGFGIKGTVSKDAQGVLTYDLNYTWNDMIDPNFQYGSDSIKAQIAQNIPFANPADYYIQISWSDKTVIRPNPGRFFNRNSGWLR